MAQKVADGLATPYDFRMEMKIISAELGGAYKQIDTQFDTDKLESIFASWRQEGDVFLGDAAYDEYTMLMYGSGEFEDPIYHTFDYKAWKDAENSFRAKWGDETYQYVINRLRADDDIPDLLVLLQNAREILGPYWGVQDIILRQLGISDEQYDRYLALRTTNPREAILMVRQNPNLRRAENMITIQRRRLRSQNSDIMKYYKLFYVRRNMKTNIGIANMCGEI